MPLLYLFLIAAAELTMALIGPVAGLVFHACVLLMLVLHASVGKHQPDNRLYLACSIVPLSRIVSLSMPLKGIAPIYWYGIAAAPLLVATLASIRLLGYSGREVGLTSRSLPLQVLIGLLGLPLGLGGYLVFKPQPLADGLSPTASWVALCGLSAAAFTDELIFRGVLQTAAVGTLRGRGLAYVSALFAVVFVGYYDVTILLFAFVVGLLFAGFVRWTGSVLGAALAHSLLNASMFVLVPLWVIHSLPGQLPNMPGASFSPRILDQVIPKIAGLLPQNETTQQPIGSAPPWNSVSGPTPLSSSPAAARSPTATPSISPSPTFVPTPPEATPPPESSAGSEATATVTPQPAAPESTPISTPPVENSEPSPVPISPVPANSLASQVEEVYTVVPGDTLAAIARRFQTSVEALALRNALDNVNLILYDQRLLIPREPLSVHVVASGETLAGIAEVYGTSAERLASMNGLNSPSDVFTGQRLVVPSTVRTIPGP